MCIIIEIVDRQIRVQTPYHPEFPPRARQAGGQWTGSAWLFPATVEDTVRRICRDIFSDDGDQSVPRGTVRVRAKCRIECVCESVWLLGFVLANARGRDSGARVGPGVCLVEGRISSGGSMKNWKSIVSAGAIFELANFRLDALDVAPSFELVSVNGVAAGESAHKQVAVAREVHRVELLLELEAHRRRIAEIEEILNRRRGLGESGPDQSFIQCNATGILAQLKASCADVSTHATAA